MNEVLTTVRGGIVPSVSTRLTHFICAEEDGLSSDSSVNSLTTAKGNHPGRRQDKRGSRAQ